MSDEMKFKEELLPIVGVENGSSPSIIKVIGVGGGGGNAVNHMYLEGFHEVNFVVCNTDSKALEESPVTNRVQLGADGLGAGNNPEVARAAAEYSIESIRNLFDDGTKMVFITAGMGGGTGTGAAPVIAHEARQKGILTVGIVTIPFLFEGVKKIDQALEGVEAIAKEVDALLVINNERLRDVYRDLSLMNAFDRADDTLSVAARSIAEIITMRGKINLDFNDVCMVLRDGGVAIMSSGYGEGEGRMTKAIEEALRSPLLNSNDIYNSKKVLLYFAFAPEETNEVSMEEMNEVHHFMSKLDKDVQTKWGYSLDSDLGAKVKVTILATGFGANAIPGMAEKDLVRQQKERENEIEKESIRQTYYGSVGQTNSHRRPLYIYRFNPEDLGNEEVISLVETTPTSERKKHLLDAIIAQNYSNRSIEVVEEPDPSDLNGTISF